MVYHDPPSASPPATAMTPLTFAVLRRLADGRFRSGAAIARELGVSRASVWNALAGLGAAGVEVHRVHGRGYRLAQAVDFLDRAAIESQLGPAAQCFRLEFTDVVGSTNSELVARAAAGTPSGTVLFAEWQSAGRGRGGRPWHAGIGGAITFSLLWRVAHGAAALSGLSLAVGVAVARALERLGTAGVALKWPNDVLHRGCKLAGILIEVTGDALVPSTAVIGIGINHRLAPAVRESIDQAVCDVVSACGSDPGRNRVAAAVLSELACVLEGFASDGFAPLAPEWQRLHAHQDRPVQLTRPGGARLDGVARGVAPDGALLVEAGDALRRVVSGDVSLRGIA